MKVKNFILSITLFALIQNVIFAQDWKLEMDKNNVKVWTRKLDWSNVKEFKGETIINSNLGSIVFVFDDVNNYTKWVYNCYESYRVKRESDFKGYIYTAIKTPWPVTNRDIVYQYSVSQNKTTKEVSFNVMAVKGMVPDKGNVRMTYMKSSYILTPIDKNRVKVVFQNHSDPAGDVPQSVLNMFITDTPYYTLLNLKKLIESPSFKRQTNKNILDFE